MRESASSSMSATLEPVRSSSETLLEVVGL
jgi:hypothetical protein